MEKDKDLHYEYQKDIGTIKGVGSMVDESYMKWLERELLRQRSINDSLSNFIEKWRKVWSE